MLLKNLVIFIHYKSMHIQAIYSAGLLKGIMEQFKGVSLLSNAVPILYYLKQKYCLSSVKE